MFYEGYKYIKIHEQQRGLKMKDEKVKELLGLLTSVIRFRVKYKYRKLGTLRNVRLWIVEI